jgi:uncharacterized protein (TIGR02118 family)
MHRLLVSYGRPADADAFDRHYRETHAPLALKLPGLVRFSYGSPQSLDPSQEAPYLVAELDFESEQAMGEAFASAEGQATASDVPTFASGGASMVHFEVRDAQ